MEYDVAIVGGGPGGSTTGCFLKKYRPDLSVAIFERERFPRDHIGESQLPPIGAILNEIGRSKEPFAQRILQVGEMLRFDRLAFDDRQRVAVPVRSGPDLDALDRGVLQVDLVLDALGPRRSEHGECQRAHG